MAITSCGPVQLSNPIMIRALLFLIAITSILSYRKGLVRSVKTTGKYNQRNRSRFKYRKAKTTVLVRMNLSEWFIFCGFCAVPGNREARTHQFRE